MRKIKVGSDFSGVGAFDQALMRLGIDYITEFACDMDKYARTTYVHNYGEPKYYPLNVYDREIPEESLDIYMTSPPCQAFSLAGKRLGKEDKRGILFFNSHEFISKNKPRFFILENVKGLLSDDNGKTFQEWINLLGGKSVNGLPILFPYEDSVPYHLYWKVLNAKEHGVPQNRERVFIIGIRDDSDNTFRFPAEEHLSKRLKDVLEEEVSDKYFLSTKMVTYLENRMDNRAREFSDIDKDFAYTITANYSKQSTDCEFFKIGFKFNPRDIDGISSNIHTREGCQTQYNFIKYQKEIEQSINQDICTGIDASYYKGFGVRQGKCRQVVKVKSATSKGYEIAEEGDSINFSVPNSETRRGRVGKQVAQTLDTACNQGVYTDRIRRLTPRECFRLMDFPDTFDFSVVSDSQAYKQAGNSIVVRVLEKIIKNLPL